jgi:hypothetical protein
LPYLPPEEVKDAFTQLISDCPTSDFSFPTTFLKHIYFPIQNLILRHRKDEPRTTNGVEAFHRHFNQQFYPPHPHIHQVNKRNS